MPTPTRAFVEIAERYGVAPRDLHAIEKWFCESLPLLPGHEIEEILETLLSWPERQPATFGDHRDDAEEVPLPRLDDCPPCAVPLLASRFRDLPRRLLSRLVGAKKVKT
jgi:hypothetical protein